MDALLQSENRINANKLIKNPTTKSEGDILFYDGENWTASPIRGREILSITFSLSDHLIHFNFYDGTVQELEIPIWTGGVTVG